jgi:hypothetical protein
VSNFNKYLEIIQEQKYFYNEIDLKLYSPNAPFGFFFIMSMLYYFLTVSLLSNKFHLINQYEIEAIELTRKYVNKLNENQKLQFIKAFQSKFGYQSFSELEGKESLNLFIDLNRIQFEQVEKENSELFKDLKNIFINWWWEKNKKSE